LVGFDAVYTQAQEAGTPVRLAADRGYDSDELRALLASDQVQCVIPGRGNRLQPIAYSRRHRRRRHNIENRFRKPQDFRRAATRYEKLARCLLALVHLASAIILLRAFVNDP